MQEKDRIQKARELLMKIAHGADPTTGEVIGEGSFLNDPQVIRCFYYVADILNNVLKGVYGNKKHGVFSITPEQLARVDLPNGKIGVSAFSKCVNGVLDIGVRNLSGVDLNRRLRQLGILSGSTNEDGKLTTVTNDNSGRYGFEMEHRTRNGRDFDMVLINNEGKRYLMENIEKIMCLETPA